MKTKLLFILFFIFQNLVVAQKLPSITEKTNTFIKHQGFINYYFDEINAKIYFEIDKLNSEMLYLNSLPSGLGSNDIGLDRGLLAEEKLVYFERVGKKIFLHQPNLQFRAISDDIREVNAVKSSFASAIIWGFMIEAEENGQILVDATDFLQRDAMKIGQRIKDMKQGSYRIDPSRTAVYLPRTKNFPNNTEIEITQTYIGGEDAGNYVRSVAASTEALTMRLHHSFVQLPDNQYQKRNFDIRSSFIPINYNDYATPVAEPINKKYIIRHRLQKKDPNAPISEAIKPIIYYLDNGTPEPIRSALLEGGSWWNQAFEAIGYKNAFQIKILPDDADPMDCRYNVINWVHRSTRGWSYGNAVVDPRTGEIIKGHVSLGSLRVRQDYLIAQGLLSPFEKGIPADDKMLTMALNRLKQLAAHEIGHTIGLQHNYSASVNKRASVMDYPHPQIRLNKDGEIDLSDDYDKGIGEWDKVSIAYGYQDFDKTKNETEELNKILDQATQKGLVYLSDQDARPQGSASPIAHLWDNGTDPVAELKDVIKIRAKALNNFGLNTIKNGQPMALLEDALVPIYNFHRYQVEAAIKIIGGLDYRYTNKGDGQFTTKSIPENLQKDALNTVIVCLKPDFLTIPERIIQLIPPRPTGYESNRELFNKKNGLTFDPLSAAEAAADLPLSLIFNPERANRLVENKARFGGMGLQEMIQTLFENLSEQNRYQGLEKLVQQQTKLMLINHLTELGLSSKTNFQVKAITNHLVAKYKSETENTLLDTKKTLTESDKIFLQAELDCLKNPKDPKTHQYLEMPPGAPIGCEDNH
jgi:hypothetical protein